MTDKIQKIKSLFPTYMAEFYNEELAYSLEKYILSLELKGIESNLGKYQGKKDIVSSLATLSFDKRRTEFFTKELLILLSLV